MCCITTSSDTPSVAVQEKQQATERQLLELSEKAAALELERDQLQRAVETATSDSQVNSPGFLRF